MPDAGSRADDVLVIGAGELGLAMLRALSARGPAGTRSLSVLLRPFGAAGESRARSSLLAMLRDLGVDIVRADLAADTQDRLASVFARFTTVICCTGFVGGLGTQRKITAAVLQAGVARYVPWQFGVDYDAVGRNSGQEVWDEQLDVRDRLRAQSRTHWIVVSTGMFTSFLFEPSFGVVDLERGRVHALGSWDNRLTVTTPDDIGRLTTAILAHEPPIGDAVVPVAGDTFSYAQLADMVEHHLGHEVERILWSRTMLGSALAASPGDTILKYRLAFARDAGVAWDKRDTFNAAWNIPVTDVATWLGQRGNRGPGAGLSRNGLRPG